MKKSHLISSVLVLMSLVSCSCSSFHKGNSSEFEASKQSKKVNVLNDKTFYYLGSSVTLGKESGNEALPEYLNALDGVNFKKEAISGTTLKGSKSDSSYVARLLNSVTFDKETKIDAFFVQLSTNDASKKENTNFGKIKEGYSSNLDEYDISSTIGALEYIINYVKKTWDTKIFIYSNAYFDDSSYKSLSYTSGNDYAELVDLTCKLEEKYDAIEGIDVDFINLYSDKEFNNISKEDYELYMFDAIHPTKAGYLKWWTPFVEKTLLEKFS